MRYDIDGNTHALNEYMREQDKMDAIQAMVEEKTLDLIDTHTHDISDMVVTLMEEHPDMLYNVLYDFLSGNEVHADYNYNWFYDDFIPGECLKLAEKEVEDMEE